MCGILAYFNPNGISPSELKQSLQALKKIKHRGPDGEGVVLINSATGNFYNLVTDETPQAKMENKIGEADTAGLQYDLILGHRRLSIIDVSTNGHQPMYHRNGNWVIFNGEIFNYIELRNELKRAGFVFNTETDTEVIHTAYEAWGIDCVAKFNGMFSVILYDAAKKCLFTLNDRFGVKPLYYMKNGTGILFMSELKQSYPYKTGLSINKNVVSDFLNNYIDHTTETIFEQIQRHNPSCYGTLELNGKPELIFKKYYEVGANVIKVKNQSDAEEQFKELMLASVKLRLRSDVPLGFACSGGLDSSSVLYLAYHILKTGSANPDMATFSAIFPGMDGDESAFIKIIEKDLGIRSNYVNPIEQFNIEDFEKHMYHLDAPVPSTSFYAGWCVQRMVNEKKIKVLLVGQGADEILGGYHHHFYRYSRHLILKGNVLEYISQARKYAALKNIPLRQLHKVVVNEVKLAIKLKAGLANFGSEAEKKWNSLESLTALLKKDLCETTLPLYLRAEDRDSMAFSIESRQPFLDYRLVDLCFSLPDDYKIRDGWQKWILRQTMNEMPESIRYRKDKKGFTTPQEEWLKKYRNEFESYLKFIPEEFNSERPADIFKAYAFGAWCKLFKENA